MEKNHQVVFAGPGIVELQEKDIPMPGEGQLLIKSLVSQISIGTELTFLLRNVPENSKWGKIINYPFFPGYSNVGIVVDAGPGVSASDWVGKRVVSGGKHSLYNCVNASDDKLMNPVPDDVGSDEAAFCTIARIAMHGTRRGQVRWGDAVVVYGAGLIGQHVARYSRLSGAMPVFVVDVSDYRLGKLPDDPLIIPVNSTGESPAEVVTGRTFRKRMADVVFETTGAAELIPDEFAVLREMGRMVIVSSPRGKTPFDFHDMCNYPSYTIIGAHNWSHPPAATPDNPWTHARDFYFHYELIQNRLYNPLPMLSEKVPWTKAAETYQKLVEDRASMLAVHFDWTKDN